MTPAHATVPSPSNRMDIRNAVETSAESMRKSNALKVSLKVAAIAAIVIGSVLAVGGGIALTVLSFTIYPVIMVGATTAMWPVGAALLEVSFSLLENDATAVGCLFTLPVAGVMFGTPFILPPLIGAAPGIGLLSLGAWGWSELSS
jgi:hypothetical protein